MAGPEITNSRGSEDELARQVSYAAEVLEHQKWHTGGAALSAIRVNDKVLEEKERLLVESIAQNYSRIKGVEKELAGLQLQLRLTSGPKRSALELLRKKIEAQNDQVVAARRSFHAARKVMEAHEATLKEEEAVKERLCQELNLLVQQSAHAQLERLEQLTQRMELLNQGFMPPLDAPLPPATRLPGPAPVPLSVPVPIASQAETAQVEPASTAEIGESGGSAQPITAEGARAPEAGRPAARRTEAKRPAAAKARMQGGVQRQPQLVKPAESGPSKQSAGFQGFDS